MSKRISITLSDEIIEELEIWAQQRGQTLAGLASHLVEKAVTEAQINTIKLSEQTSSDLRKLAQQKGLTPAAFAQKLLLQGLTNELREES